MFALFTMAKLHIYIRPTNTNNTYLQINTKRLQNNTQEKDIHQKMNMQSTQQITLTPYSKYFNHIDYSLIYSIHTRIMPTKRAFFPI
mgnify:CR=1 FL=1